MAFSDPKNVLVRAQRMMDFHLNMLAKLYGPYEKSGDCYYFSDSEQGRINVKFAHGSKLLSKVYTTMIIQVIGQVEMEADWKVKSSFLGNIKLEGMIFKGMNAESKEVAENLNQDNELTLSIFSLVKDMDLQKMTIEYEKSVREIQITFYPYAGTLVWIKIPPIYQDTRLKEREVEIIFEMSKIFENYFRGNRQYE